MAPAYMPDDPRFVPPRHSLCSATQARGLPLYFNARLILLYVLLFPAFAHLRSGHPPLLARHPDTAHAHTAMRRRTVYQNAPPPDATRYPQAYPPAPNLKRHTRTRTQSGPLPTGTRPRPSSPRPLHWRAGVYFGTPAVAYAHETGHRPHQSRQRQQYGSIASRWSPPKFATAPRQYGPAYATRRPQHQRRPTEAQVIAARYRTQKPLPPTPVSSTAGMSLGPVDSLFVNAPSSTLATSVGSFPDPRAGGAEYKPRVEERYVRCVVERVCRLADSLL